MSGLPVGYWLVLGGCLLFLGWLVFVISGGHWWLCEWRRQRRARRRGGWVA